MKAGVISAVKSSQGIEDYQNTVPVGEESRFEGLNQSIEIRKDIDLENGRSAQIGRAAIEDIREVKNAQIHDSGEIKTQKRREKYTKYTEFIFVPESFIAVGNSSGTFLFDLLNNRTNHEISRVDINLNSFADEHSDALTWKIGFNDRGERAENGVIHGNDVLQDGEVGDLLGAAKKNQIGLEYNFEGALVKLFATESSYVEIYQPDNYDELDFIHFVEDQLLHHLRPR